MDQTVSVTRRHRGGATPGDVRRTTMLEALNGLLEQKPLAEVGIPDITAAAGVSRSAFYFYFPSKAAAVAGLIGDMYDHVFQVAVWFDASDGDPVEQLREGIEATVSMWRSRPALMVAMLDATRVDPEVRATWIGWLDEFAARGGARILADRSKGYTGTEVDAGTLARVLVGGTFAAMEHDVRELQAGGSGTPHLVDAIVEMWARTVYEH